MSWSALRSFEVSLTSTDVSTGSDSTDVSDGSEEPSEEAPVQMQPPVRFCHLSQLAQLSLFIRSPPVALDKPYLFPYMWFYFCCPIFPKVGQVGDAARNGRFNHCLRGRDLRDRFVGPADVRDSFQACLHVREPQQRRGKRLLAPL